MLKISLIIAAVAAALSGGITWAVTDGRWQAKWDEAEKSKNGGHVFLRYAVQRSGAGDRQQAAVAGAAGRDPDSAAGNADRSGYKRCSGIK